MSTNGSYEFIEAGIFALLRYFVRDPVGIGVWIDQLAFEIEPVGRMLPRGYVDPSLRVLGARDAYCIEVGIPIIGHLETARTEFLLESREQSQDRGILRQT